MHMQDWRGYGIVSWNGQTLTTAWYQITLVTFPNSPNSPNAISGFILVDDDTLFHAHCDTERMLLTMTASHKQLPFMATHTNLPKIYRIRPTGTMNDL
jgi:hypothetical protein